MRYRLLALLMLGVVVGAQAKDAPADLVLEHGTILTMDAADTTAQAIAVRGGRIIAVGADADIAPLIGLQTKVIDLKGRTATPGLIDTHAHVLTGKLIELNQIGLTQDKSVAAIIAKVKARAATALPGGWIEGGGWNEGIIAEHRGPTLAELDAVSGNHPVLLMNVTGHYVMVNSATLKRLAITRDTSNPQHGTIERDAAGNATGILKEAAQDLAYAIEPPPTDAMRQAAIRAAITQMHAEGMTGVKDPDLQPAEWEAYVALARREGLGAHVCTLIHAGDSMATANAALETVRKARVESAALPDLKACGVKIFLDGALMARTAWMKNDYPPDPHHPKPGHGYPTVPPDVYRQMVKLFTRAGVAVGTHVIGDAGIDVVTDAYTAALAESPRPGLRHSLIHVSMPGARAFDQIAALQKNYDAGIIETQPEFLWALAGALPLALTAEQRQRLLPLATYKKLGIIYASSSDYPVTPLPARYGLAAAVTRAPVVATFGAHPFGTAEVADVHDALRSYTIWAAHQMFLDKETGSLETGKLADIAVWDRNPYAVPGDALRDMRCLMTFYKGRQVFGR